MIPIRYLNGSLVTNSVLVLNDLSGLDGTPLDPKFAIDGSWIDLPISIPDYVNRKIDRVFFPPVTYIREGNILVLHVMQVAAQMLLVAIENFKDPSTNTTEKQLVNSLTSYQTTAIRQLFGRGGYIAKHLMCCRMRHSGRAVALARAGGSPFICELPPLIMSKLHLSKGSLVIIGRDPTIWDGGIEVLRCKQSDADVIRLHPLAFKQLGLDSDGDTVWVLAIPRGECEEETKHHIGSFMRNNATWPVPWKVDGERVEWDNVETTLRERAAPTGFSVSPRDIIESSPYIEEMERITSKELKEECVNTAQGLSLEKWKETILEVNNAMLQMKVGLGPVGAAAIALRAICNNNPRLKKSAGLIAERIEQLLLDAKQAKDKDHTYSYVDALDILHIRSSQILTVEEATAKLVDMLKLNPSVIRPIIAMLYERQEQGRGRGLAAVARAEYPLFAATTQYAENPAAAAALAINLFHNKKLDPDGLGKIIVETLKSLKEEVVSAS